MVVCCSRTRAGRGSRIARCSHQRGVLSEDAPFADIFLANVYEKGQFTLNHIDAKYIKRPLIVTSPTLVGDHGLRQEA